MDLLDGEDDKPYLDPVTLKEHGYGNDGETLFWSSVKVMGVCVCETHGITKGLVL